MRVGRGRRFRKLTPPAAGATGATRNWCHPQLVPPATGATRNGCHPQLVPPATGATLQFGSPPNWCHPRVRARQPGAKTVPPVGSSPKQSHPSVRIAARLVPPPGSSRRFVSGRFGREAQYREVGATPQSARAGIGATRQFLSDCQNSATRRFVSSRVREEARNRARNRATRQFGSIIRPTGATR